MAVKIEIVIPSMGRADRVITKDCITHGILCVPESEKQAYEEHNPGMDILTHPDSLKGLALKRQFIYEHYPNSFQIDDDIKSINRLYTESGEKTSLSAEEAYDVIQFVGNMAKLAGCYLFGLNHNGNPLGYHEFRPIRLTGPLNGCIGLLEGSKLYFDKRAVVSEDYWIAALNAYHHRMMWIDERFSIVGTDTFHNSGGCSNYRTLEQEAEDTMFLRKTFGECITLKKDTSIAKRKHPYQRGLNIPF
jgi:hypothetical protein|nr:MAG TPA: hypothetical protein [Caudoviricetes sp.]